MQQHIAILIYLVERILNQTQYAASGDDTERDIKVTKLLENYNIEGYLTAFQSVMNAYDIIHTR